ncbi:3-hydroxyacyl-CoA dehydrogenase [Flavobacterium sp. HSC-61S13]|uniref:3-hydroxyacyl-CoA dehydrogenase n=1 Tax=Flavobacterium sp. HSC-61S13 TaxID=2910963 RepID=UPI00209CE7A1|nr:3-hydroxyacyl-CoA dehydrogenase [Flavobacterium sp. HSC-61S13]MCP1997253.1 3-hydroxybutyryl-CoA dehydrogenase [Flavobacterium sp. HSC-61S13]
MEFKKITTAGSGVLGAQVTFHTAFQGYQVSLYDLNEEVLEKAKKRFQDLKEIYKRELKATQKAVDDAYLRIEYFTDLKQAVRDADLLIESIPEDPKIKREFYQQLALVAPVKTIFVTNSSTLVPSLFAEDTGRPKQFLALHFANEIWKHNTAEIMGHELTDLAVFDRIVEFAVSLNMVPIELHKEQSGYILDSLLIPLLNATMNLLVNKVADPQAIDKAWVIGSGATLGPCAILDLVGLNTVYNIHKIGAERTRNPNELKKMNYLKENFIDKGKLGKVSGQGFYTYPNPEFENPDFYKSK